jgi:hypothetical protein
MNYMLNIVACEISPLLLENVALRMGNLQVTKISCGREWTPHKCVLGALIRNEMGILLLSFYSLRITLKVFHELLLNQDIMRFYVEALVSKIHLSCWNYSAVKFKIIWYWILKDKYLFIQFMFLEKECDIPFKLNYLDFYYEIFMLGKRGVTVPTSDSELYVEDDVMDIVSSRRREVGWNRIHVNVPSTPLDIVSFHYKVSIQKWKFVF